MIAKITRAFVRTYHDNGQTKAYAEWVDHRGKAGRTEGDVGPCRCCGADRSPIVAGTRDMQVGPHIAALFARAQREGLTIEYED